MEWRSVIGFDGQYEVSSEGDIRRVGRGRGSVSGRILKQTNHLAGYKAITLYRANKPSTFLVHRLVADAFIGDKTGCEVNHRDGNKRNNRITNLEYVTRSENIQHAMSAGLIKLVGTENPSNKLTERDVLDIRSMHTDGSGYKSLAKLFDVSPETIRDIIKGRTWRHLIGGTE